MSASLGSSIWDSLPSNLPTFHGKGEKRPFPELGGWVCLTFLPRLLSVVNPGTFGQVLGASAALEERGCGLVCVVGDPPSLVAELLREPRERGGLGPAPFPVVCDGGGQFARSVGMPGNVGVGSLGVALVDPTGVVRYRCEQDLADAAMLGSLIGVLDRWLDLPEREAGGNGAPVAFDPLDASRMLGAGSQVGPYRVEELLGEGALSTAYRATDLRSGGLVTLKILRPDCPVSFDGLLDDVRQAAVLSHNNVQHILEIDDRYELPLVALEYLAGRPISDQMTGAIEPTLVANWMGQAARGLAAAHDLGLVHGDLKPRNLFLTDSGRVAVLDLGFAQPLERRNPDPFQTVVEESEAQEPDVYGNHGYTAPEQTRGVAAKASSDVFAFGAILFELLSGQPAFPGKNYLHVLLRIQGVRPDAMAECVPEIFRPIVRQALNPNPDQRVLTMHEIVALLGAAAEELSGP
jgi:alkyl hydroperoxide reductase subunit AhpC